MVRPGLDHPSTRLARAHDEHLVGFYDSEAFLTASIADFIAPALSGGEAAVLVVTARHGALVGTALRERGFPVAQLRDRRQLLLLDADDILLRLLDEGMPDPAVFAALVGDPIDREISAGRDVRCFGEMVALLWAAGNIPGVLALEGLWNDFLRTRPVPLYCAYPMGAFDREESEEAFHEVCDAHSVVLPSERYSDLPGADERSRAVAVLQHEAVVGINERIALRQALHQREAELQRLRALERVQARLVEAVTPPPSVAASGRGGRVRAGGLVALRKTACRQVRAVLDASDCAFVPTAAAAADRSPPGGSRLSVPVAAGGVVHGALHVQLRARRALDADERRFLDAVAGLLAVGLLSQR